ncbi:hypothetical protein lerEdw1_009049 [Lerista edwardsae]|nr:hypothetical protein lerEdw1_009049 [Lerista edwardsae]
MKTKLSNKAIEQGRNHYEGDGSPAIVQKPQFVVKSSGEGAVLDCFLEGSSNPNFYWYRQRSGGRIEQLAFSVTTETAENVGPAHIKGERPKDSSFTLRFTTLLPNDTGTYYCAWSRTLCQASVAP